MDSPRFTIFRDSKGGWRFRLRAKNGEIIVASESYSTVGNANRGIHDLLAAITEIRKPVIDVDEEHE